MGNSGLVSNGVKLTVSTSKSEDFTMPLGRFGLSPAHGIWKPIQRSRRKHATIRLPEQLETRNLLAGDTSTSLHVVALDVNADGALTQLAKHRLIRFVSYSM